MPAVISKGCIVNIPARIVDEIKNIPGDKIVVREHATFYMVDVPSKKGQAFDCPEVVFDKEFFLNKCQLRLAIEETGLNSNTVDTIVGMDKYKLFTFQTEPELLRQGLWARVKYFGFVSVPADWYEYEPMLAVCIHNVESEGQNCIATFPCDWIKNMGNTFWEKLYLESVLKDGQNLAELIVMAKDRRYPEPEKVDPPSRYTLEEIIRALSLHSIKLDPKGLVEALHLVRKRITAENELTALVDGRVPFSKKEMKNERLDG